MKEIPRPQSRREFMHANGPVLDVRLRNEPIVTGPDGPYAQFFQELLPQFAA